MAERKTMPRRWFQSALITVVLAHGAWTPAVLAQDIVNAPAFSDQDLTALPAENWITNGGNTLNQRYSPLTRINRYNVGGLKAKWRTAMGSGAEFKNGGQAQILHYEGTLYVANGMNDVFAMDVKSGRILWTHHGEPNPRSGNPIGWVSRGVALGDGKVFMAQVDARLKALDQQTGRVLWDVEAEPWSKGISITSAPLYYRGLVVTGFSGGEMGTRGRVKAFDADTGELVWTFYTVPGPGEFGHDTWPQDSTAWMQGGAPVWQTPAYDPELGLIYFSTGNPGPDLHGGVRPGDNLFSVSIVALDAMSGEYRWHFQQVHHDIWDYDSPNPVVLFDAVYDGVMRKALVQVSKTGWAYILDRATGEPLLGIEERPVAQEARQATAATQPYPVGDAIVPQAIDAAPELTTVVNEGRIFTPFWDEPIAMKPGTMGGANWPPSSYDPESHQLFVCASDRISTFQVQEELNEPGDNVVYMGGRFAQAPVDDRGIFAALNLRTNTLDWRREWREICYSGSVNTAGGLVFVGRNDGRLTALDKRNGDQLWEFMTDAGVNTTVSTFEYEGEQMVVVHAGGTAFAGSKRGDAIWMFSLDGSLGPVTAEQEAAPSAVATGPETSLVADLDNGSVIYDQACAACHGETGQGGQGGGPPLDQPLALSQIMLVVNDGRNTMPAFAVFSAQELLDISTFVSEKLK
ncbi:MAG: PQQ-binding-like beta-propeller repeat protein [Pseudomonadales bacterium]|nr:PQQ-binding-like beta-propeller repeat protein [Pseudomonadales bacterium]